MFEEMIVNAEITDKQSQQKRKHRFVLQPSPLGAGATAVVYHGIDVDDPSHQVAVKIARTGSTEEDLRNFWEEQRILQLLYQEPSPHVPWVVEGKIEGEPRRAIIVMELVAEQHELRRQAKEGVLDETLAVEAGYQYAELLALMHEQGIASRGDRKAADLRWIADRHNPAKGRLVVLDWNRARQYRPDNPELEAYRFQDLRVFGRLWAEHLLGRNVDNLPAVDDTVDKRWAELTRSLRVILTNSLHAGPGRGYRDGNDLMGALAAHRRRQDVTKEGILTEAGRLRETPNGEWETPVAPTNPAEEMWVLIDWAGRKGAAEYLLSDLEQWSKQIATEPERRAEEAVKQIEHFLRVYKLDDAVQVAEEAVVKLGSLGVAAAPVWLRVCRWRAVAKALREIEKDANLDQHVEHLRTAVTELERATAEQISTQPLQSQSAIDQSRVALQHTEGVAMPAMQRWVNLLRYELEIHEHLLQVRQGATKDPQKLMDYWQNIERMDRDYAASLSSTFPIMAEAVVSARVRARWESLKAEFDAAVREVFSLLPTAVSSSHSQTLSRSTSLETAIKEAHRLWEELSTRTHFESEREQLEKKHDAVVWADGLWEAIKSNQLVRALSYLPSPSEDKGVTSQYSVATPAPYPQRAMADESFVAIARDRFTPSQTIEQLLKTTLPVFNFEEFKIDLQWVAYHHATKIASKAEKEEQRWPEELAGAWHIIERLQKTGFPTDESAQETRRQLATWEGELGDLRRRLQWQENEELNRFCRRIIETPTAPAEADKITRALQEAVEKGIEVIDRQKLPGEIATVYSVGTFLTLRTLGQVPKQIVELAKEFEEKLPQLDYLVEETNKVMAKFRSRYGIFQREYDDIEDLNRQFSELNQNFDQAIVVLFAQMVTAGLEAARNLNDEEVENCLQNARQLLDKNLDEDQRRQLQTSLTPLQQAHEWLTRLSANEETVVRIRDLKSKLQTNDHNELKEAIDILAILKPEITPQWLIRDLRDEYERRKAQVQRLSQKEQIKLEGEIQQQVKELDGKWQGVQSNLSYYVTKQGETLDNLITNTDELINSAKASTASLTSLGSLTSVLQRDSMWVEKNWLNMSGDEQKRVLRLICLEQKLMLLHETAENTPFALSQPTFSQG